MTISAYRARSNGRYPVSLAEVRRLSPIAFGADPTPEVLDAADVDPVLATAQPGYDPETQTIREGDPTQAGDEWVKTWVVEDIPDSPKRYSKRALFDAMTDEEYGTFESVEAQQNPKDRRVFREAQELNDSDPSFPIFLGLMTSVYGPERAGEIMEAARVP